MKKLSDLSPEELKALSPGDEVLSESQRASDFIARYFDSTIILAHFDGSVSASFLVNDQVDAGFALKVSSASPEGAVSFDITGPTARAVLKEIAQLRASPSNFGDLAAGLLEHLAKREPGVVAERRKRIEAVLKGLPK